MERIRIVQFGVIVLAFGARPHEPRRSLQAYAVRNCAGMWEIFQPSSGRPVGITGNYAKFDHLASEHPKKALQRFVGSL